MKIQEIYDYYKVPDNLQEHMLRTAAVAWLVCEYMQRPPQEKEIIVTMMLLHDIANIVKYDLTKSDLWSQRDREQFEAIATTKADMIARYGTNSERATVQILGELGVDQRVIDTLQKMAPGTLPTIAREDSGCPERIGMYSDMRVTPMQVTSLMLRIADAHERYEWLRTKIEEQITDALILDQLIFEKSDFDPAEITEVHAQLLRPMLLQTDIPASLNR